MEKTNLRVIIGSIILLIWTFITLFSDVESVNPEVINQFYVAKGLVALSFIAMILLVLSKKMSYIDTNKTFLVLAGIYSILGEVFCPGYHLSYIQVTITTVLIYKTSKKFTLWFLTLYSTSFFVFFEYLNFNKVVVTGYASYFFDISMAIVLVPILAASLYIVLEKMRVEKEFLESKFLNLGNHTANIVHDLKGQLSPPLNYIKMLKQDQSYYDQNKEIIDELEACLNATRTYVVDTNKMVAFQTETGEINLQEATLEIKQLLGPKLKNVEFKVNQKQSLTVKDLNAFKNVLYNLIINSVEAFSENQISYKEIDISTDGKTFTYKDNAGGFPKEILKKIKNKTFISSKKEGSGLGYYFISKYSQKYNLALDIKNENSGIKLTMKLGK